MIPATLDRTTKWQFAFALTLEPDRKSYRAHTVLSLPQARLNARLLAPIDQDWLKRTQDCSTYKRFSLGFLLPVRVCHQFSFLLTCSDL